MNNISFNSYFICLQVLSLSFYLFQSSFQISFDSDSDTLKFNYFKMEVFHKTTGTTT